MSRTEHPGSTGGWASTFVEYDILGRVKRQSVPTETNSGYTPTGDDSAGALWTYLKYDWMGRVVRKINTDGVDSPTLNDSDVLISYEGCGCAGGLVTTVQGEKVDAYDIAGTWQTGKRRVQKMYDDILGRSYKSEQWDLDGVGSTPYATVVQTFDGADRPVRTRQFAGGTSSGTYQDTTATFDGHGRLYQSHRPEQRDSSNNLKYTTYSYNPDDRALSVTDSRGAVTNFEYNSRGLLTEKSWSVPGGSGITDPTDVTFSYDDLGNRTSMVDGLGQVDYEYDSLSRLTSELRDFTDTLASSPISGGKFELEYTYTLSGALRSYTDAYGKTVNLTSDKMGRLNEVSGTSSSGTQNYADNPHYRAWGALTHLEYGNGTEMNVGGFNNKLQATNFEVKKGTTYVIDKSFEFYADGAVKRETDATNAKFGRLMEYDHQARIVTAKSGAEARGSTDTAANIPFGNAYQYDAFNEQTQNAFKHFSRTATLNYSKTNGRFIGTYWTEGGYDNEGNQLKDADTGSKTYSYDAAGRFTGSYHDYWSGDPPEVQIEALSYDGDGKLVKRASSRQPDGEPAENDASYQIRSAVLGGDVIVEAHSDGSRSRTFVRAGGTVVAMNYAYGATFWMHKDPSMNSIRPTDANGNASLGGEDGDDRNAKELDVEGKTIGYIDPYAGGIPDPLGTMFDSGQEFTSRANGQNTSYTVNGVQVPVSLFRDKIESGLVGGTFGLVETAARISNQIVGWRITMPKPSPPTEAPPPGGVTVTNLRMKAVYNDSGWALSTLIHPSPDDPPEQQIRDAFAEAKKVVGKEKCASAIADLLQRALRIKAEETLKASGMSLSTMTAEELKQFNEYLGTLTAVNAVGAAETLFNDPTTRIVDAKNLRPDSGDGHSSAEVTRDAATGTTKIAFYAGFFNKIMSGKSDITSQVGPAMPPKPYRGDSTSISDRALTILHEGFHSIDSSFTDEFLGQVLKKSKKLVNKTEGSQAISSFLRDKCS